MVADEGTGPPPGAEDLGNGVLRWTMQPVSPYRRGRALAWVAWGLAAACFVVLPLLVGALAFYVAATDEPVALGATGPAEDGITGDVLQIGTMAVLVAVLAAARLWAVAGYMLHHGRAHLTLGLDAVAFSTWSGREAQIPYAAIRSIRLRPGYSLWTTYATETVLTIYAAPRPGRRSLDGVWTGAEGLCAELARRAGLTPAIRRPLLREYRRSTGGSMPHGDV